MKEFETSIGGYGSWAFFALVVDVWFIFVLIVRNARGRDFLTDGTSRLRIYFFVVLTNLGLLALALGVTRWQAARVGEADFMAALANMGLHLELGLIETLTWTAYLFVGGAAAAMLVGVILRMADINPTQTLSALLPHTAGERAAFGLVVSPLAGLSEEILFRGFLLGQFWLATGDGWMAAVLSSVAFGIAHYYQGAGGIVRTTAIGMVLAAGTVMTGSLIPAILAHTLIDMMAAITPRRAEAPGSWSSA